MHAGRVHIGGVRSGPAACGHRSAPLSLGRTLSALWSSEGRGEVSAVDRWMGAQEAIGLAVAFVRKRVEDVGGSGERRYCLRSVGCAVWRRDVWLARRLLSTYARLPKGRVVILNMAQPSLYLLLVIRSRLRGRRRGAARQESERERDNVVLGEGGGERLRPRGRGAGDGRRLCRRRCVGMP